MLSEEHLTVNSTLIEARTSLKSFRPKGTPLPSSGGGHNPERIFGRKPPTISGKHVTAARRG
jgi:hypothetical protein